MADPWPWPWPGGRGDILMFGKGGKGAQYWMKLFRRFNRFPKVLPWVLFCVFKITKISNEMSPINIYLRPFKFDTVTVIVVLTPLLFRLTWIILWYRSPHCLYYHKLGKTKQCRNCAKLLHAHTLFSAKNHLHLLRTLCARLYWIPNSILPPSPANNELWDILRAWDFQTSYQDLCVLLRRMNVMITENQIRTGKGLHESQASVQRQKQTRPSSNWSGCEGLQARSRNLKNSPRDQRAQRTCSCSPGGCHGDESTGGSKPLKTKCPLPPSNRPGPEEYPGIRFICVVSLFL